jgi:hypothetical protein
MLIWDEKQCGKNSVVLVAWDFARYNDIRRANETAINSE